MSGLGVIAEARAACPSCPSYAVCPVAPLFLQTEGHHGERKRHPHAAVLARHLERLRAISPRYERELLAAMGGPDEELALVAGCLACEAFWDEPERLWPVLLDGLCANLRVARAGIFSRRDDVYVQQAASREIPGTDSLQFADDEPLVGWLEDRRQLLRVEALSADPPAVADPIAAILRLIGAEAVLPLEQGGRLRGWLYIGPVRTGGPLGDAALDGVLSWGELATSPFAAAERAASESIPMPAPAPAGSEPTALILDMRNRLVAVNTFVQLLPERVDDPAFREEFMDLVSEELAALNALVLSRLSDPPAPATEQP